MYSSKRQIETLFLPKVSLDSFFEGDFEFTSDIVHVEFKDKEEGARAEINIFDDGQFIRIYYTEGLKQEAFEFMMWLSEEIELPLSIHLMAENS